MTTTYTPKHTDEQYARFDPFAGDKGDIRFEFRNVKVVRTRKPHTCIGASADDRHEIAPGTRARVDTGKLDGKVDSVYICLPCLDSMVEPDGFCWVCGQEHSAAGTGGGE